MSGGRRILSQFTEPPAGPKFKLGQKVEFRFRPRGLFGFPRKVLDQAGEMGLACAEGHIRRGVMSRAVWRSASAASAEVVPRCK